MFDRCADVLEYVASTSFAVFGISSPVFRSCLFTDGESSDMYAAQTWVCHVTVTVTLRFNILF